MKNNGAAHTPVKTLRALRSIRPGGAARFFWVFLIGNVFVTAAVSLLLYAKAPSELEKRTIEMHHAMLLQASRSMDTALLQTDLFLRQLSIDSSLTEIPKHYCGNDMDELLRINEKLDNMRVVNPYVLSLAVYFPAEERVFVPNAGFLRFDEDSDAAIREAAAAGSIRQGWLPARKVRDLRSDRMESVISVVKFFTSSSAERRPFAVANIYEDYLRYLSGTFDGMKDAEILLVESGGEIFSALNDRGSWARFRDHPAVRSVLEAGNGFAVLDDAERYLFTAAASALEAWSYIGFIPMPAISRQIRFLRTYSLAVIVFGMLSSLAFSFFFSRRLTTLLVRLLKTVSPETAPPPRDLLASLEHTLRGLRDHSRALETNLREQLPILRNNVLEGLFKGRLTGLERIDSILSSYGIRLPFDGAFFCIVAVVQDNPEDDPSGRYRDLSAVVVLDMIREAVPDTAPFAAAFTNDDEVALLVGTAPGGSDTEKKRIGSRVLSAIENQIAPMLEAAVEIGIGGTHEGLDSIGQSYREARHAVRWLRAHHGKNLVTYRETLGRDREPTPYSVEDEEALVRALRQGDRARVAELHRLVLRPAELDSARAAAFRLLSALLRLLSELGIPVSAIIPHRDPFDGIVSAAEFHALDTWFARFYDAVIRYGISRRASRNRLAAEKAAEYVQSNFREPLTLSLLSRHVYLSEAYLSRIFREEMGLTLKQYINTVRLEQARRLLANSSITVAETGRRVGYPDPHGFMKFFKEQTGLSPKEYRTVTYRNT